MTRDQIGYPQGLSPQGHGRRAWLAMGLMPFAALAVSGCGTSAPKIASVSGSLQSSADLNPSVSQRPSPLILRVYELKSDTAFNRADFMSLYQSEQTALGADVVSREEITLQPGETRPYNKQLGAETRFIGVFAAYRNLEQARWRALAAVAAGKPQKLLIRAEALAVSVQLLP